MVSRRNYFIMTVMMFVLLFLFMSTRVFQVSRRGQDSVQTSELPGRGELWSAEAGENDALTGTDKSRNVLLVAEADSDLEAKVRQWCTYSKKKLQRYDSLAEVPKDTLDKAGVLLLQPKLVDWESDGDIVIQGAKKGQVSILCGLPDATVLRSHTQWQDILGISAVTRDLTPLSGVKLFSGFLLGGEAVYQSQGEEDVFEQDMGLSVPWYTLGRGTKVYMVGLLGKDSQVKNELLPPLLWRNRLEEGFTFVVKGEYLEDYTALGILDSILAETGEYELYPVVNAQNLSLINYPGFANENEEQLMEIYSRDQQAVYRDIMTPGFITSIRKKGLKMTAFMTPQVNYEDDCEPDGALLDFYLQEFYEENMEAGLSLATDPAISVLEKVTRDYRFFQEQGNIPTFQAVYADRIDLARIALGKPLCTQVRTIVSPMKKEEDLLSYVEEKVTAQGITSDGFETSFSALLQARSLQTALGYSNIGMDVNPVIRPESEADYWENIYDRFSRNMETLIGDFDGFERTTLSESDLRVRRFLNLDYDDYKDGSAIWLTIRQLDEEAWFMLRTHGEKVGTVQGGEAYRLEDGAYLLRLTADKVRIVLEPDTLPGMLKY
ncbi:MAG: DUF2194 domain-containing protein [Acetatifactor sp.]